MFKHISLSLCLCLLAMGLNSLLVTPSDAQQQPQQSAQSVTNGSTTPIEQGSYVNREGHSVRNAWVAVVASATAQCHDASHSFSMKHRGTCPHHGGVSKWL